MLEAVLAAQRWRVHIKIGFFKKLKAERANERRAAYSSLIFIIHGMFSMPF